VAAGRLRGDERSRLPLGQRPQEPGARNLRVGAVAEGGRSSWGHLGGLACALMPRIHFSILVGALCLSQSLGAQSAPISLEEAVSRAMQRGPAAQASSAARHIAVGRARGDAQLGNPTFELRRENEGSPLPYDDFATFTLPVSITGRRFALRDALGAARERGVADSLFVQREAGYAAAREWWA